MILNEHAMGNEVQVKLQAFIAAAESSPTPYTTTQLVEMVQEQLTPLSEGFLEKYFSGTDDDLETKIRAGLAKGIKTESDRKKMLDKIDDAIDNSNRIVSPTDFTQYIVTFLSALFAGPLLVIVRAIVRRNSTDQRKAFREIMYKLRTEVKALKL